jgi:hypothetical protein
MKRIIFAVVLFASALSLLGCATTEKAAPTPKADQAETTGQKAKPLIKCSTCGVEFTTREEAEEHIKTHPEHKTAPME